MVRTIFHGCEDGMLRNLEGYKNLKLLIIILLFLEELLGRAEMMLTYIKNRQESPIRGKINNF